MSSATAAAGEGTRQEIWTLGIVAAVHLVSHFYWLVFIPLLPMLKDLLGVSYVELGFALAVMNVVSALTQAPTGFLVDRFGPRLLLVLGVLLGAAGFTLVGLFPSYHVLLASAVLVGLGNAVYHPADFSILSAEMSAARMGRAYSAHAFSGYLGFAAAPPVVLGLAYFGGPRFALVASALIGVVISLPLLPGLVREQTRTRTGKKAKAGGSTVRDLLSPSILALTVMFTTLSLSTNIMQTYMVVSLDQLMKMPHALGNTALTVFLFMTVAGIVLGGVLADRAEHKSHIAALGFGLAAICVSAVAIFLPGHFATVAMIGVAGFLAGIIVPSRDLLVKAACPPDAVGRVFGIVTTGFNFGGMIGPLIGGALIDHKMPAWIFYVSSLFMCITIVIALGVDNHATKQKTPKQAAQGV